MTETPKSPLRSRRGAWIAAGVTVAVAAGVVAGVAAAERAGWPFLAQPLERAGWLARRPLRFLHALGGLLGWAAYLLSPSYRQRLKADAAFAGMGPGEHRAAVA